jgi:predicted DNA-binding transcriptional regulator YafY
MVPPVYFPKVSDASFLLDSNEGIVAMYTVNGTTVNISQTINCPTSPSDWFGYSLAIFGDRLIIGAPGGL